jgi:hypothetical protein
MVLSTFPTSALPLIVGSPVMTGAVLATAVAAETADVEPPFPSEAVRSVFTLLPLFIGILLFLVCLRLTSWSFPMDSCIVQTCIVSPAEPEDFYSWQTKYTVHCIDVFGIFPVTAVKILT